MIGELPRHAGHGVADDVAVHTTIEEIVRIADPDALEIAHALDAVHFLIAAAGHARHFERRPHLAAIAAQHHHRNVAVDAAADFIALGVDLKRLGDGDRAVDIEHDV